MAKSTENWKESANHNSIENQLKSKLKASENRTLQLEEELSSLKQVKAINQLQNLANLQQHFQTVQNNIYSLTVTSQARGHDMISPAIVSYKEQTKIRYSNRQSKSDNH